MIWSRSEAQLFVKQTYKHYFIILLLGNCSKLHFILSYWCITKIPAKPFNNHSWKIRVIGHIFMIVVHWDKAMSCCPSLTICSLAVNHWNHIRSLASTPVIFSPHTCASECMPKANRKSTPIFHCLSHDHLMLKKKYMYVKWSIHPHFSGTVCIEHTGTFLSNTKPASSSSH